MNKLFKTKEDPDQQNPMEQSEYCYYQSFGRALVGFAKAIELRQGRFYDVTAQDILEYADIDKAEFDFLFGNPLRLIGKIEEELHKIFADADTMLAGMEADLMLESIFQRLKNNSPMLTVLRLTNNHVIWREVLKNTVLRLSVGWPEAGSEAWEFMYHCFCCYFALLLEKWETADYSEAYIDVCVKTVTAWLQNRKNTGSEYSR